MDINVRIKMSVCTLAAWIAWICGSALVILQTIGVANQYGRLGILIVIFGTVVWTRQRFCTLAQRELVAFDHGRQLERSVSQEVVPLRGNR